MVFGSREERVANEVKVLKGPQIQFLWLFAGSIQDYQGQKWSLSSSPHTNQSFMIPNANCPHKVYLIPHSVNAEGSKGEDSSYQTTSRSLHGQQILEQILGDSEYRLGQNLSFEVE